MDHLPDDCAVDASVLAVHPVLNAKPRHTSVSPFSCLGLSLPVARSFLSSVFRSLLAEHLTIRGQLMRGTTDVRCGLQKVNRFCPSGCSCIPPVERAAEPIPIHTQLRLFRLYTIVRFYATCMSCNCDPREPKARAIREEILLQPQFHKFDHTRPGLNCRRC